MEIAALGLRVDGARGIVEAADSLERLGAAAEKAEKKTGGVTEGSKKAGNALADAARSAQAFNNSLAAAASRAKSFAIELGAVALAAVGLKAATQTLAGFEKSMASVGAVTRASAKDMQAMREEAKRLGVATEFSASQAADGFMYLGLAGWTAEQSIAAIPAVVDLATAASMGLADAADTASNIMSAFGIAADDATKVTDVLAAASSRANTDVHQLGEGIKYVGPVAAAMGISVGDAAAAMGVLADAGIQASMGGTGLRRIISSLANPTKEATRTLESMGLSIDELNPKTNTLEDIVTRLAGSGLDAAEALTIFGDRGGPAILALTDGVPKLKELTATLKDVDGESKRMADTMRDNLKGDLLGLGSALEGVVTSLGEAGLTKALRMAAQGATLLLRETSSLIDYLGGHLPAIGAVMAVTLGPQVFLAAAAGFKALSIAAVSAVRAITVAVAANPIGLLAVAAAMLLGEMYSLKDEVSAIGAVWDMLSDSVQWGWNILKDGAKTAFSMMGELGDRIVTVAGDFDLSWHGAFMAVTGGLDTWYGGVLGVVAGMGAAFRVLGENIGIIFSNAANKALSSINGMLDKISGPLKSLGIDLDLSLSHGSTDTKLKSITEEVKKAFDSQAGGFNLQEKYIKAYGLREIDRAMKDVEKWSESTADSVATVTEELNNNSRSLVDNSKKLSEAAKAAKKFAEERVAAFQKQREGISDLQKERRALEDQITTFGQSKRAIEQLTISRLREQAAVLAGFAGSEEAIELLRLEIEEREKLLQAGFTMDGLERGKKAAEELAEAAKRTHDDIEKSLTDALLRGFEGGKGFAKNFLSTLKNMFSALVLRPIIQPIAAGAAGMVTGALGFGGAANAQGAGGIDPLSGASLASKMMAGSGAGQYGMSGGMSWFTGFGGNISNTIADWGANLAMSNGALSNFGGMLLNNAEAIGNFASAAGAAFNYGKGIYDITQGKWGGGIGAIGGQLLGGPIGGMIGNALGGMLDGAFKGETRSGGRWTYDKSSGQSQFYEGPSGGYGGQATTDAMTQVMGTAVNMIDSVFEAVGVQAEVAAYKAMFESSGKGRGGTFSGGTVLIDGQEVSFGTNVKGAGYGSRSATAEQSFEDMTKDMAFSALEAWQLAADQMPSIISDMLSGVDIRALSAEQADALAVQISGTVQQVSAFSQALTTLPFENLRALTFDLSATMLQAFGGIENAMSGLDSYYQNFYSDAERHEHTIDQLTQALAGVGVEIPALTGSTDDMLANYRALVEAQDNNTEAGQQAYVTLIQTAGAFADVAQFAGQANAATGGLVDNVAGLSDAMQAASRAAAQSVASAWSSLGTASGWAAQYLGDASGLQKQMDTVQASYKGATSVKDREAALRKIISLEQAIWQAQQANRQAEVQVAQQQSQALQQQLGTVNQLLQATQRLKDYAESLQFGANSGLSDTERLDELAGQYLKLLGQAQGGDVEAMGQLQGTTSEYLSLAQTLAGSQADYSVLSGRIAAELAATAVIQEASAKSQADILQAQIDSTQAISQSMGQQFEVSAATKNLIAKQLEDSATQFDNQMKRVQRQIEQGDVSISLLEGMPAELTGVMMEVLVPPISSIADAAMSAASMSAASAESARQAAASAAAAAAAAAERNREAATGAKSYDVGTSFVPHDMTADIHRGEIIIDPRSSDILRRYGIGVQPQGGSSNAELIVEIRALREQNARLEGRLASIERSTGQLATQFDNVSAGGNALATEVMA